MEKRIIKKELNETIEATLNKIDELRKKILDYKEVSIEAVNYGHIGDINHYKNEIRTFLGEVE